VISFSLDGSPSLFFSQNGGKTVAKRWQSGGKAVAKRWQSGGKAVASQGQGSHKKEGGERVEGKQPNKQWQ
jgi:hypothetical protein